MRLTESEQKILFRRWENQQRQDIAHQSEPSVKDIAEAFDVAPDEIYGQLQALRAEQSARQATRRQSLRLWGRRVGAALVAVSVLTFIGHESSRAPRRQTVSTTVTTTVPIVPPIAETPVSSAERHDAEGAALYRQGRYPEAEAESLQAVQQQPQIATYRNDLGNALDKQRKYEQALAQYQAAVRLMPDRELYVANLANTFLMLRRDAEAEAEYKAALKLNSTSADDYGGLGIVQFAQGKYGPASEALRQAVDRKPDDFQSWLFLGHSFRRMEHNAQAEQAYRTALGLKPQAPEALDSLGIVMGNQQKVAAAIGYFRQAAAMEPSNAQYRAHVRQAQKLLGGGH